MQFTSALMQMLHKNHFLSLTEDRRDVWIHDDKEGKKLSLLYIIPERLPGQPARSMDEIVMEQKQLGNKLMLATGKLVEWLILAIGEKESADLNSIMKYDSVWWIDHKEGILIVYENQPDDYCGLRAPLENFLTEYVQIQKESQKKELRNMFTPMNTGIVVINIIIFAVLSLMGDVTDPAFMAKHGAMYGDAIFGQGEYYRLFSAMFLHFGPDHLFQNMLVLLLMGSRLEKLTGKTVYLLIYIASGLLASLTSLFFTLQGNPQIVSAGASGAIFGVIGGVLAFVVKDVCTGSRKRIRNIGLTGIIFMVMSAVSYGFFESGVDNAAHVGGLLAGVLITMIFSLIIDRKLDR